MNNKLIILSFCVITAIITFFSTKGIYHNPPAPTKVEYIQGAEKTVYIQGKIDTVFRYVRIQNSPRKADPPQAEKFDRAIPISETDTLHLSVNTYPAVDSIDLSYVFKLKIRDTYRTDTLYLTRIDTVRTVQIVQIDKPKRFYEQPLLLITAGALAGSLATIYITK